MTPVSERVPRVRPPHGFALFLAKEEARKVKRLHSMLRVSLAPFFPLSSWAYPSLPTTEGPSVGVPILTPLHLPFHLLLPGLAGPWAQLPCLQWPVSSPKEGILRSSLVLDSLGRGSLLPSILKLCSDVGWS